MTADVAKEASMVKQKVMIAANYDRLTSAHEVGRKMVSTFVPGNLTELLACFDVAVNLPEINALNNGMRKTSGPMIAEAERLGLSEDVCTYVKADIGMMAGGAPAPNGKPVPNADLLLLSQTGCFTFVKWFELLRDRTGAEIAMLHVPYDDHGGITGEMRDYVVRQLRETVIPALERCTGIPFDIDRLREHMRLSAEAEDHFVRVLESARATPSPIDAYFGGCYYIGPIFTAFRGTTEAVDYYRALEAEVVSRAAEGRGPVTPDGEMTDQKYRLVIEGPPNWTSFREFWKMFGLPARTDMLVKYVEDYGADGLLVNSIKSCNSFSAGQLLMMNRVEERTGKPAAFIETDLVDPRYFSAANVRTRLESYFQMIDQRRG